MTKCIAIVAGLFLFVVVDVGSAQDQKQKASLRGLKGVSVNVGAIDPVASMEGVTSNSLKAIIESNLRKDGIRILTPKEREGEPGMPELFLAFGATRVSDGCTFHIILRLEERAKLLRDPSQEVITHSWSSGYFQFAKTDDIKNQVNECAGYLAILFADEFIESNKKK